MRSFSKYSFLCFPALILPVVILLTGFACKRKEIPVLDIQHQAPVSWQEKESCNIAYSSGTTETEIEGRIKCRGGSSSKFGKHSYTLELNSKYRLGGLPEDDDWIINAAYIDKTFMRHKISYDLYRQMDSRNAAPQSTYVKVLLNGDYQGLYVLMEEVNGGLLGLDKKDSMAMLFKDPLIFYEEWVPYFQDSLNYHQQKYPKPGLRDMNPYMDEFRDFLFHSSDEEFTRKIATWVDLDRLIDWHIMLLFSNSEDGLMKNFYLYKLNATTPFRFAIWDYDHSFGRDGDNEMNMLERVIDTDRAILFRRIFDLEELNYTEKLKERWVELRKQGILSRRNFNRMIRRNHRMIRNELQNNFEKWPEDASWYFDAASFEEEIELMKEFVSIRIKELDEYFGSF